MSKKIYFFLLLSILIILSSLRYNLRASKRSYSDFHVIYITGKRFLRNEAIYTFEGDVSYYKYTPFYAFLLAPLSSLEESNAALLWHLLNWLFLILIFYYGLRIIAPNPKRTKIIYLLTFITSLRFILENLDQGQANIFMLSLTLLGLYCFLTKKETLSAFYLALASLTKYFPLLFLPYFLIKRHYRVSLKFFLFVLLLYFSPLALTGLSKMLHLTQENISFLFKSSLDDYSITCYPNQSLLACLRRLFTNNIWYQAQIYPLSDKSVNYIYFGLIALLYMFALHPKAQEPVNFCLLFTFFALANPNAWKNFFLLLLLPNMLIIHYLLKTKDKMVFSLFLLSFIFGSLTSEFFVYSWAKDWFEIHSFVTYSALLIYLALLKIKYLANSFPKR